MFKIIRSRVLVALRGNKRVNYKFSNRSLSTIAENFDIVISGGGMVGTAMAGCLATSEFLADKSVLLLEMGKLPTFDKVPEKYSNRVSSISPGSRDLFKRLGVWDWMQERRVKSVNQLQVWDGCSNSRIHFEQPGFETEVSHIVENNLITAALFEKLAGSCPSVTLKTGAKIKSYTIPENIGDLLGLELEDGTVVNTKLLIGADGAQSSVRKAMGTNYVTWAYDQKGVVATLKLESHSTNDVAYQRFMVDGPIALLPLNSDTTSLVWSTSALKADEMLALSDVDFTDSLNNALHTEFYQSPFANKVLMGYSSILDTVFSLSQGDVVPPPIIKSVEPNSRAAFPFAFGHSTSYIKPRVALVGDAAHRIHPLAGQGVNLGFGDVIVLLETLEEAAKCGADLGSTVHLSDYETNRLKHNAPIMLACDWLNRLYSTDCTPMVLIRSLGLSAVNRLEPLKRLIVQRASH